MTHLKPLPDATTAPCCLNDHQPRTCQGTTVMKWSADGSLTALDQADVLRRLCESDPNVAGSDLCIVQLPD